MIQRNTPELFVRDVEESIRFYTETLGFQLEGRMPEDQSKPVEWAMVASGNASFMFQKPESPKQADGVVFYLAVDDADAKIEDLRARGAIVEGPVDQFYGYREATVTDPSGVQARFHFPRSGGSIGGRIGRTSNDHLEDNQHRAGTSRTKMTGNRNS